MQVLIVYAHPEPKSFNGAMKDLAVETPYLFFHPAEDYGPDERLKPGVQARSGVQGNV
jgi:hypothetical protein